MSNIVDIIVGGLVLGAIYAIIALGYTMVYGIIELINFAHGDVFAFGAFLAIPIGTHFVNQNSLSVPVATSIISIGLLIIISALACALLGVIIERVAYRPLRNAPKLAPLITAIGVSLILENALSQWQGGQSVYFPILMTTNYYPLLGTTISNVQILVIVVAIAMMIALDLFVNRSRLGKAMRAVAQDREAASMMGINVDLIISLTFFIGSALAGAGAVIYGIDIQSIGYSSGFTLGLFAFTAAVLGGIGNIRGAMLGGLVIGLISQWVDSLYGGTAWYDVVIFAVLVLVLVLRPTGFLGTNTAEKV